MHVTVKFCVPFEIGIVLIWYAVPHQEYLHTTIALSCYFPAKGQHSPFYNLRFKSRLGNAIVKNQNISSVIVRSDRLYCTISEYYIGLLKQKNICSLKIFTVGEEGYRQDSIYFNSAVKCSIRCSVVFFLQNSAFMYMNIFCKGSLWYLKDKVRILLERQEVRINLL